MQDKNLHQQVCTEDEIDLRELFLTLKKKVKLIIFVTLLITTIALVYVFFKNPIPVYRGHIMIEIGEVKSCNPNQVYFDSPYNLKVLLEQKFDVKVDVPKHAINILIINHDNSDKKEIVRSLQEVINYILDRHKEKASLYNKYIMTKQVGNITIDKKPINKPKKKLIIVVAFVTGLILSIFLVFFMEFIKSFKKEDEIDDNLQ